MEKMTGHTRLYRRGAVYYHRAAIPVDIAATYPKTEEVFSLRTKDKSEALRLVRLAAVEVDQRFEDHRHQQRIKQQTVLAELTNEQIKRIGEIYFAFRLEEDQETREDGFFEANGILPDEPRPTFEEYGEVTELLDGHNRHNHARGKIDAFFMGEAEEVLSWDNVNLRLAEKSLSWKTVARELQAASIRAAEAIRARNLGDIIETPSLPDDSFVSSDKSPLLSVAIEEWASEKARTTWAAKTEREHRVWTAHFLTASGDRPIETYGKDDGRKFKKMLLCLPANWNQHRSLKHLRVDKAAEKAEKLQMTPMSHNNVNKIIGFVASFWNWTENNFDRSPSNPLKGLKVATTSTPREERDPFTWQELQTIFDAPIYRGYRSRRFWKQTGNVIEKHTGIFWVPLVGLYTGMRLGEIIQLYISDVRREDGIWCFDVNDDGEDKSLKNSNSKRLIPVHPSLFEMGLLDHVRKGQEQGEIRLFPDLQMGRDGYYSSPFSKHFARFLKSIDVKTSKNAFHSFRHNFEDACRNSDVPKEVMDALQGHGEDGMAGRYGRGFTLQKLDEEIRKLRHGHLDLSHLHDLKITQLADT